jgi:hypothetical protein
LINNGENGYDKNRCHDTHIKELNSLMSIQMLFIRRLSAQQETIMDKGNGKKMDD